MKLLLPLLFTLGLTSFVQAEDFTNGVPPAPDATVPGRFTIVAGMEPSAEAKPESTMFRIDTVTGQTWVLRAVPLKTVTGTMNVPVWLPLNESGSTLHQAAIMAASSRTR